MGTPQGRVIRSLDIPDTIGGLRASDPKPQGILPSKASGHLNHNDGSMEQQTSPQYSDLEGQRLLLHETTAVPLKPRRTPASLEKLWIYIVAVNTRYENRFLFAFRP